MPVEEDGPNLTPISLLVPRNCPEFGCVFFARTADLLIAAPDVRRADAIHPALPISTAVRTRDLFSGYG